MKILQHLEELNDACEGGVCMTIGVFDAVHRGHQKLISRAREEAEQRGAKSMVFTFERHPLALLAPVYCPPTLTQPEMRERLIEPLGVDLLLMLRFTKEIAAIPPEQFIKDVLVGRCGVKFMICGQDFSFGAEGKGNVTMLRDLSGSQGYDLEVLSSVKEGTSTISSSRIRGALLAGQVSEAATMLERRYSFVAEVVTGDARGRQIGFPTANLVPTEGQLIPADGVYATLVKAQGHTYGRMLNIGSRPTFEGAGRSIEVHLFSFDGELVGENVDMEFVERVRDERKFDSVDALVDQLKNDEQTCKSILARQT